jgi:SAM-dependent methyltransferase
VRVVADLNRTVPSSGVDPERGLRTKGLVFGSVAEQYDRARPGYSEVVVDDVFTYGDLVRPVVLEIGSGTGKATVAFAARADTLLGLEPDPEMAKVARQRCAGLTNVEFESTTFEGWPPASDEFDLVISAQAWHWVDPGIGYPKAAAVLRPGGTLALMWHRSMWPDGALRTALVVAYETVVPGFLANTPTFPGLFLSGADRRRPGEIEATGLFVDVAAHQHHWNEEYSTADYLELLSTQSDHVLFDGETRARLFEGVSAVLDSAGGRVRVPYVTHVFLARRPVER